MSDKTQDPAKRIAEIAATPMTAPETFKALSELPIKKMMITFQWEDGHWSSMFRNMDLSDASFALCQNQMIVNQQHSLLVHANQAVSAEEQKA